MTAATYTYDAERGRLALDMLGRATARVQAPAADVSDALMTALMTAEALAASKGFAVPIPADNGEIGYVVGGARDALVRASARTHDQAIYLAVQQAVRRAQATATAPRSAPVVNVPADSEGAFPVLLVVAGVALLVAGAWFAGRYTGTVEVEGAAMARVKAVELIAQGAMAGTPIDDKSYAKIVRVLEMGELNEGLGSVVPWLFGGLALAAGGWWWWRRAG